MIVETNTDPGVGPETTIIDDSDVGSYAKQPTINAVLETDVNPGGEVDVVDLLDNEREKNDSTFYTKCVLKKMRT